MLPATSSLVVRLSARPRVLQEGQELSLSCSLDAPNLEEKFFTVAWLRGGVELARIGPSGILTVGSEYSPRADGGELQAARKGVRDYSLILQPVRAEDQGEYVCRAWPQLRGQDGVFTPAGAHDSDPDQVKIAASGQTNFYFTDFFRKFLLKNQTFAQLHTLMWHFSLNDLLLYYFIYI